MDDVVVLAHPATLNGKNLAGVWYRRTESGWEAKSWDSGSPYEVVKAIKAELNVPDEFDAYWYLPATTNIASAADLGAAEDYHKGVLASDPLAGWVESQADRDGIIAVPHGFGLEFRRHSGRKDIARGRNLRRKVSHNRCCGGH